VRRQISIKNFLSCAFLSSSFCAYFWYCIVLHRIALHSFTSSAIFILQIFFACSAVTNDFKANTSQETYQQGFFFKFLIQVHEQGSPTLLSINVNGSWWAVRFLQNCSYKWQPKKCLSLDVTNFYCFFQNGKKIPYKSHIFIVFSNLPVAKIRKKKKHTKSKQQLRFQLWTTAVLFFIKHIPRTPWGRTRLLYTWPLFTLDRAC